MDLKSTSTVSITNLSDANQAYIKNLQSGKKSSLLNKAKDFKDVFISSRNSISKKNRLKVAFFGGLLALAIQAISLAKKNPAEIMQLINKLHFNNEKIFDAPIDLEKYYQSAIEKLKDIQLTTVFDEKTVTDDKLEECLKKIGCYSFQTQDKVDLVRKNPTLLHVLNLLSGMSDEANYGRIDFLTEINKNAPIDEIENLIRYLTVAQKKNNWLNSIDYSNMAKEGKTIIALNNLINEVNQKLFKTKGETVITNAHFDKKSGKSIDEFLKFLGSLRKGTVLNGRDKCLERLFTGNDFDDYRKARKFYESIAKNNPDVLKKLDLYNIRNLLRIEDKSSVEISNILNNIPQDVLKKLKHWELETYVRFNEYYGINNINQLSIEQKRKLLRKLVSANSSTFSTGKNISNILPTNQKEYCALMDKLAKSIGVDTKKLTPEELQKFNKAIEDIAGSIQEVDFNNTSFELDFSRSDFIEEVQQHISKLSDKDKMQVMDYFGFEIKDGKMTGYPIDVNNGEKLAEVDSESTRNVIKDLKPIVKRFCSTGNRVTIKGASQEFNDSINELFECMPELKTMIQKAQHETHAFTLDIHVFKVLQNVCSNPKFNDLSADDKKVLQIASLLHDITKAEGMRDYMHPIESAFDAYYIIQKLNLPENQQLKIYELIKTHNWLQQLNNPKTKDMVENIAQDIAFDSRHTNTFELAKILCEADLKSVKKNASFFDLHKKTLEEMSAKVDGYVKQLHETQIILPQTQIPGADKITGGVKKTADGITNTVLYMDKLDDDLSKYGFSKGTTKANWTGIVHALDYPEQMSRFNTFNIIDTEALLSTSFINPEEYRVFRKQGFILDVNFNDIHAGYESDFGTGCKKTIDLLKEDYLFYGKRKHVQTDSNSFPRISRTMYRTYISDKIRTRMGLTPEEYYERISKIQDCKSITDIEQVDKEFADSLINVFKNMHSRKRSYGRKYNEMLVSRPKIKGVFAYDKKYEDIPEFLRKYAEENNLPVIIFGKPI